jgi:hypothetical protein
VDIGDYLGWDSETEHRVMTVYASGDWEAENLALNGDVLRQEAGRLQFYGDLLVVQLREVDGEEIPRHEDFRGTWLATEGHLFLTTESEGESVEIIWAK